MDKGIHPSCLPRMGMGCKTSRSCIAAWIGCCAATDAAFCMTAAKGAQAPSYASNWLSSALAIVYKIVKLLPQMCSTAKYSKP